MLEITTHNTLPNNLISHELHLTLQATRIEWHTLGNLIRYMARIIQLALKIFKSSLSVKGCTKSWEAHSRDNQVRENESRDIGMSQRVRTEGNTTINNELAMKPRLAKKIEKACISIYFESSETDLHIAANACCIEYSLTWSLK